MPRGGARVNSGPAPDPDALRRDRPSDKDGWTVLPAAGRSGAPPKWPLASVAGSDEFVETFTIREREIWKAIWATPQAVAWDRLGWTHDVAIYVRLMAFGEGGSTKALAEARQWSDRLGLNPAAMMRNRWKVSEDDLGARRQQSPKSGGARDRLKALSGGAG